MAVEMLLHHQVPSGFDLQRWGGRFLRLAWLWLHRSRIAPGGSFDTLDILLRLFEDSMYRQAPLLKSTEYPRQ